MRFVTEEERTLISTSRHVTTLETAWQGCESQPPEIGLGLHSVAPAR